MYRVAGPLPEVQSAFYHHPDIAQESRQAGIAIPSYQRSMTMKVQPFTLDAAAMQRFSGSVQGPAKEIGSDLSGRKPGSRQATRCWGGGERIAA